MKRKWSILVPVLAIVTAVALGATIRKTVVLTNFNSGELAPTMEGRADFTKYRSGARELQNMIVRSQGPVSRRPGTKYIASVKDSTDATRLIPFEYSTTDAYAVELGDAYARFYRNGAQVLLDSNAYEIVTPWDANDIFELQFAQDAQYMRIVHPDYAPYKLTRDSASHTDWSVTAITFADGPFLDENEDTTSTIAADAITGDVNLVATGGIFDSNHVGALWEITHLTDSNAVAGTFNGPWTQASATGVEQGSVVNDGEGGIGIDANSVSLTVYEHQTFTVTTGGDWWATFKIQRSYDDGTTWNTIKSFTYVFNGNVLYTGTEEEGDAIYRVRIESQYVNAHMVRHGEGECTFSLSTDTFLRHGVVEITAVTDANTAAGTVQTDLASTDATWRWAEGAWSDYRGWPRTVEHHEQRCLYGGNASWPQTIWASVTSSQDTDYDDFDEGLGDAADAWTYVLSGMSAIQWMKSTEYLMVGTTEGVGRLGLPDKPMDPTWPPAYRLQARNGCAYIDAIAAIDAVLYVERGAQKVREVMYTYAEDRYIAPDMTILAEHIGRELIVEIDFQERPDPILWAVRDDGVLLSFTYQRKHEVLAWARHITGQDVNDLTSWDEFESIAVIPGGSARANGDTRVDDEIWAIVKRTVDSNTVRYVEQFQPLDWGDDPNYCWFVDCADYGTTGDEGGAGRGGAYPTLQSLAEDEIPDDPAEPNETALSGAISVTDAAGLAAMTPGNHYSIDGDIDCTAVVWTPLTFNSSSAIVIEGNGNTISNLSLASADTDNVGFIGLVDGTGGGQIRNLTFADCSMTGDEYVGILCGLFQPNADWDINDITITGGAVAQDAANYYSDYIGLLCGMVKGSTENTTINIRNCSVSGTVTSETAWTDAAGGLIGKLQSTGNTCYVNVTDCTSAGTMSLVANRVRYCGGLIGELRTADDTVRPLRIYDCSSTMDITFDPTDDTAYAAAVSCGGLVGLSEGGLQAVSSFATGDIDANTSGAQATANDFTGFGGFVGTSEAANAGTPPVWPLQDASDGGDWYVACYATGDITISENGQAPDIVGVGGFIGDGSYDLKFLGCYATGDITIDTNSVQCQGIGGFAGTLDADNYPCFLRRCSATGDLTFNGDIDYDPSKPSRDIGGFLGSCVGIGQYPGGLTDLAYIQNCYCWGSLLFEGTIDANVSVGGFLGDYYQAYVPDHQGYIYLENCYCAQTNTAAGSDLTEQITNIGDETYAFGTGSADSDLTGEAWRILSETAVYYDNETSAITDGNIATGHTTVWMQTQGSYEAGGWDFNDIWYMPPATSTNWDGYDHALGLTFCAYADGRPIGTFVVDGDGELDVGDEYDVLIAGLNYYSILETMPLIDAETIGRPTAVKSVAIDFIESMGAHVGADMTYSADWHFSDDDFATSIAPYTGYKPTMGYAGFLRGMTRQPVVYVWEWDPIPMTIRSITANLEVTFE
jgi:hypothetical protein